MENDKTRDGLHSVIEFLKAPISDVETLLGLLSNVLEAYNLLPPKYRVHLDSSGLPAGSLVGTVPKTMPRIQRILLIQILPTWDAVLDEHGAGSLVDQFFVPDSFLNASPVAGSVALCAYGVLLAHLSGEKAFVTHSIRLLERLVKEYPIDRLYRAIFANTVTSTRSLAKKNIEWQDTVKDLCMVSAKVSNAILRIGTKRVPDHLENANYFNALSIRLEDLVFSTSTRDFQGSIESLTYLLHKLVNVGLFPPNPPTSRSQPSFFASTLPRIRQRLSSDQDTYSKTWQDVLLGLPTLSLQPILTSLFGSLPSIDSPRAPDPRTRAIIKHEATFLQILVGKLDAKKDANLWHVATSLMLSKEWKESDARIFVCWVSGGSVGTMVNVNGERKSFVDTIRIIDHVLTALEAFLEIVLDQWGSSDHIKHSLTSRQRCMVYTHIVFKYVY